MNATEPLYLADIIRQWLKDDPDLVNYQLKSTNRLWFSCRCHSGVFPQCCVWSDCVQVIVVSGFESFDIEPQDPDFFEKLKAVLLKRCKQ